jgi:hypothetical protein
VDVFDVFRTVLVVVVSVSILVPLNIPLAALAYKVHLGTRPMPMEPAPFWIRATFVALGLAAACVVLMFIDYWLVVFWGLPAGFVHGTMLMLYAAGGVWYMFWVFALDELMEGVSVFVIYLAIPGLLLAFLLMLNLRWWPVPLVEGFLLPAA